LQFFNFPNGCHRHLLFLKSPNFLANGVHRIKTHEHVKFWQNRSIGYVDIKIFFLFFKVASAAILNFQICEISLADSVVKIGRLVVEILQFFEFSKWPSPLSWIFFKIKKFYWLLGRRVSRRICMPNFVKIGQSAAKILRFFDFSRWRRTPSWIVKFTKFHWLSVVGWPRRITSPNFIKIGRSIAEMLHFSYFQDGHRRHLEFLRS